MEEIDGPRDRKLEPEKVGGNISEKEDAKVEDKLAPDSGSAGGN